MHKTQNKSRPTSDSPSKEPTWKIENVVATAELSFSTPDGKIDLNQISRKYNDCEYNPERFPGLVMRLESPKSTVLLFSTGKMVITGLRDESNAKAAVDMVHDKVKKAHEPVADINTIAVQNIVASGDLHYPVDLNEAAIVLENATFEPEVFPGMVYRMTDPKSVFLVFSTGRIVCTGTKNKATAEKAIKKLGDQLRSMGLELEVDADAADFDFI